ncbi:DUF3310 domain-containing protein [Porphyromonas sp.]
METNEYISPLRQQIGGSHYKDMVFQPISLISLLDLDFFQGNVVKYVSRHRLKDGVRDLAKAKHYCQMAMELDGKKEPDAVLLSEAIGDVWDFVSQNQLDFEVYMILMHVVRVRWEEAVRAIDELINKSKQA